MTPTLRKTMPAMLNPLIILSAWVFGPVLGQVACDSDYLKLVATHFGDFEGCYRKSDHLTSGGRALFTSEGSELRGTPNYAISAFSDVRDGEDAEVMWVIGELFQVDDLDPDGDGFFEASISPLVPDVVCTDRLDLGEASDRTTVREWQCNANWGETSSSLGIVGSLTCGCSEIEERGGGDVWTAAGIGSVRGSGAASMRALATASEEGVTPSPVSSAAVATGDSDSNDWSNGQIDSFWTWIFISAGVAGLICLCCVGWYIRNPWCKSPPRSDPSASAEDAAPNAPQTFFQPWGKATAPPE